VAILLLELLALTRDLDAVAKKLFQEQAERSGEQFFDRIGEGALPIVRRQGDHD
jgi:hypothetical protein